MLHTVLIEALAIASGGLMSVGSILVVLLLLGSKGGLRKASAYFAGYAGGYILIGWTAVFVGERLMAASASAPRLGWVVPAVSIGLGALFIAVGLNKLWRGEQSSTPPKFFAALDGMSTPRVFGLGAMITVINPKNLAIYLSAVSVVVSSNLLRTHKVVAIVGVALFFCLAVLCPLLLFAVMSERAVPWLASLRRKLEDNSRRVAITMLLVFGSIFAARGLWLLLGKR